MTLTLDYIEELDDLFPGWPTNEHYDVFAHENILTLPDRRFTSLAAFRTGEALASDFATDIYTGDF
jgi:hypothetical protein